MILSDIFQGHDIIQRQITQNLQGRAIFRMANQQKVVYSLSNGAIFNDHTLAR